jgi:hypothetical protein
MITTLVTTQNYFLKNKLDALLHVNEPKKKTYHKKLPFYVGEISQLGEEKIYKKTEFGVFCCHKFRKNRKTFTSHFYFHNSFIAKFG